ncbi:MAG TPA: N-acetylmuramoyl-L-alanine amidase [Gemmatimonadaceae bacterium]|nr:N-acetylmuramoyl-L-alanine amidase [Gemmatimonadaceae bacterium]
MITTRNLLGSLAALTIFSACASAPASTAPTPEETPEPAPAPAPAPAPVPAPTERVPVPYVNPALPAVPHVDGPIEIKVIYPPANQLIQAKDSNFIFGSVGDGDAALTINGIPSAVWPNGAFMAWLPVPTAENPVYEIVASTGADTKSLTHPVKIAAPSVPPVTPAVPDTITPVSPPRFATLVGPAAYASDTDRVVTGYALTGGIQRWFLLPNTRVKVVGTKGTDAYVRLDTTRTIRIEGQEIKIDSAAVDSASPAPAQTLASAFTFDSTAEYTDLVIPVNARPAYLVDEGGDILTLTLYGTKGPAERQINVQGPGGSYVTSVSAFSSGPQMQYIVELAGPIYGYQPLWEEGKFTLRVRKPPTINPAEPLRGLTITVDPGHPPIGATGPTGLWEPEVTLPVGLKLRDLLQEKGVNVVMTRTTPDPVDLNLRGTIARRANANAFVSIHLNAVPDGTNPFRAQGTATYHYHLHSGSLAKVIQAAEVAQLALPDNGVNRANFAVVRGTWMPMVLVEGAFIIMPDQEAALRTPEYQARYAQGIVDGLEAYFRTFAPAEK